MKKNVTISLILGIILSGAALYFALRNVPFDDLLDYLGTINYLWIIPSVLVVLLTFVLRVLRWQTILGSISQIGFWRVFHPLMIGFMLNCILPGRVGEVARPAILKKKEPIPFSTGLATIAAERVFDLILLVVLFAVVLAFIQIDPNVDISFGTYHLNKQTLERVGEGMFKLCLVLIAGIILVSIHSIRNGIKNIIKGIPSLFFFLGPSGKGKINKWVSAPLIRIVENIAFGFTLVQYPKKIGLCMMFSFLIWSFQAFSYYLMALGCPGIELSFFELFAVMIIVCFFIVLPSAPGFWGLWEAGGVFALSLFGVSSKDAAGFTLTNHVIQIFPVIILGLVSAVVTSVNIWQVSYGDQSKSPKSRFHPET